jgi:hypothetical protein
MEQTQVPKKEYVAPSLSVIGRITELTGMFKNGNYLDNSNGSDAWRTIGS